MGQVISWPWEHRGDEVCATVEVEHGTGASAQARHRMVADLERFEVPDEVVGAAELVLGELVANAVRHGRPTAAGTIEVEWCVRPGGVRLSVRDGGHAGRLEARPFDTESEGGRGLSIVERLCEHWDVERTDGVRITAALAVSERAGA